MSHWTRVFRFGHTVLVQTNVNDSPRMLFGLDTGAFANILSVRAGRQVSKVSSDDRLRVHGLNGEVNKVYSAKAALRFGHLQQPSMDIVTLFTKASFPGRETDYTMETIWTAFHYPRLMGSDR